MAASRQSVSQTFFDVISWRPVLEPVLRAFEPLLECREELGAELTDSLREAGVRLPEMDAGRAQQGASLLAGVSLWGVVEPLRRSAEKLLPLLENMESMAPHLPGL